MSSASGFFGTAGVAPAAIGQESYAATYQQLSDPKANSLYDFLGMPNRHVPVDAYTHRPRVNYTLLDAYNGRNAFVSDTFEGLTLSDNEAHTLIFMPWVYTDEKNFKFNTIEFNRALPGPTPHEGTSRLLQLSESSKSFTSQRYGIKFRMEGDFAETAQGQAAYFRNLIQMSQSVQELANYGCEMALLNCKRYNQEYAAQHRERGTEWKRVMIDEVSFFAGACLDANKLEKKIEDLRLIFQKRLIEPDTILGPPGLKLFFGMEMAGTRTGYSTYGPDGAEIFREGPRAAGILRGDLVVFESREFDVNTGGPAVMPMERPTTVGECYPMNFGPRRGELLNAEGSRIYQSNQRDLYLYDLNADDFKRVSFEKAFLHSGVFMNADHGYQPDVLFEEMAESMNRDIRNEVDYEMHRNELERYRLEKGLQDAMGGEEMPARALPMFISHDTPDDGAGSYFTPSLVGQFDMDVINTNDLIQMARTILNRPPAEREAILAALETCVIGRVREGGEAAAAGGEELETAQGSFQQMSANSTAHLLNLTGSNAALVFGALPLGAGIEAMMYAPIDASKGKLGEIPSNTKLSAWLNQVQSAASLAKSDKDAAFRENKENRENLLLALAGTFNETTPDNCLTMRQALVKVFDDNVKEDGSYRKNKSFATLSEDVNAAMIQAARAAPAVDTEASRVLAKYKDDLHVNPFGTGAPSSGSLSETQRRFIQPKFNEYIDIAPRMEERVMLHGNAAAFKATNVNAWVQSISAGADADTLTETRRVAERYQKAHDELHNAVTKAVYQGMKPAARKAAKRNDDRDVAYERYMASWGKAVQPHASATQNMKAIQSNANIGDFLSTGDFLDFTKAPNGVEASFARNAAPATRNRGAYDYRLGQAERVPNNLVDRGDGNTISLRDVYLLLLDLPNKRDCWEMLIRYNVHVAFNLLLFRLWIRNVMFTAVMFRSGLDTGGTIYGHANFAISGEVATKTLEAHLTFNYASLVWNDKGVMHINNLMPRRHLGGWNCEFIMSRNEILEVDEEDRGSLVVTMVPVTENCWKWPINFVRQQRIIDSIRGTSSAYKDKVSLFGTHSSQAFVEKLWQMEDSVKFSEAYDTYSTQYRVPNTIAYEGKHFSYSVSTGGFDHLHNGNGHLSGNRTGRGAKDVWEGGNIMFPDQDKIRYHFG